MSVASATHCINPDCLRPNAQPWGNKFCNSCGASLELKNRYIPLQFLGSGGFASIYTVLDLKTNTEKVLKVLVETAPKALELFEQEAAVLASLRHPGVPKVEPDSFFIQTLSHPQARQLPCLVMEKINGPTLADMLDQYPQGCPEGLVFNWLKQAVEILQELHKRKIIHRDLKPSNLMLRQDTQQLVMIDFGGAKQIGWGHRGKGGSSTRLVSPGYSPPEQVSGGTIVAQTDFYALGRTMIHLLTGKYPADLEDPITGDLLWRNVIPVGADFADVLDEMVQADVQKRPASAAQIQRKLAGISTTNTIPSWAAPKAPLSIYQVVTKVIGSCWKLFWVVFVFCSKAIAKTIIWCLGVIAKFVLACLDTVWEMLCGGIGAFVGASVGFYFGDRISNFLTQTLPANISPTSITVQPQIILFALAGLGTAVGLTVAGGFGQRRRFLEAALVGMIGYALAWSIWQALGVYEIRLSLMALITVAVTFLTLGLGLMSHHFVHALVAASGTATFFYVLVILKKELAVLLISWLSVGNIDGKPEFFIISIIFFGLLAITVAFWLGISYYVFVPFLRWLGWR
ncbi:serine/threonine protein kinase [Crinalium epipsammum PCC 9333]|uniref:non-specific serine/threonine protein kinase n=1 Tax=Crinalium epipsammum PCC 9333 TaxID=1173022 RepID=K9W215_9CYAN|nr:serine/threonine-protein kinase [Crinalium epipsammum]AFZ14256.1 serine/threonine protein kinase [Crinalium epipsammum PCC 9333]